jgi:hypothetical protein
MKYLYWAIIVIVLLAIITAVFTFNSSIILINNITQKQNNSSITSDNQTIPFNNSIIDYNNTSFILPSNDYVINHINWSTYPDLPVGYVQNAFVSDPTSVVDHKFIAVDIVIELRPYDNKTVILNEMAGVASEARTLYGLNSSINIWGNRDGVLNMYVVILPNSNEIHKVG